MTLLQEIAVQGNGTRVSVYVRRDGAAYTVHSIDRFDTGNFYKSAEQRFPTLQAAVAEARATARHAAHVVGGAGQPHTVYLLTPALRALAA